MMKFNNFLGGTPPHIPNADKWSDKDKAILAPLWDINYHSNEWLKAYLAGENNEGMQDCMIQILTDTLAELKKADDKQKGAV